ncbi:hypothetical protein BTE48_17350, partial [Oceanospirillum multiglobuliferum]
MQEQKYLGITIDHKLKFEKHINEICTKAASRINAIKRIRRYTTTKQCLNIYKATVLPLFDIGDILWRNAGNTLTNQLQVQQNKALRVIFHKKHSDSVRIEELTSNLIPLELRRKINHLTFI